MSESRKSKREQRRLIACTECRQIRTRCEGNESQKDPCHRCKRLSLPCIYARKRRRTRVVLEADAEASSPSRDRRPATPSTPSLRASGHVSATYLDPRIASRAVTPERVRRTTPPIRDDPVTFGLLSLPEAEALSAMFMRQLNPLISLLDPTLHTFKYMRTTSPALLSAVLMCAAQFFKRDLYPSLREHARSLTDRATSTGEVCVGTVQALMLMLAWKEPTDGTGGIKLAVAVRMGYQLGLHHPAHLPADEDRAREIADGTRTWFVVAAFDRINSDVFGLPGMIPVSELPDCESWAQETERFHGGDMRHACSTSSASIYLALIRLRRNYRSMPAQVAHALLADIYTQFDAHLHRWFPEDPRQGRFSLDEQAILKWFDLNHLLRIKFLMLDVCPPAEQGQVGADWLTLAERFTTQTETIAAIGYLGYMQDTSVTHLSTFGVIGHKREVVVTCVRRLAVCSDAARGGPVIDLVARFLARLLRVLERKTDSPVQSAIGAFDLDEFLRQTQPPGDFDTPSLDDEFWTMLFPNPGVTVQ